MTIYPVEQDYELRKFIIEVCQLPFERGCAYYQFVRDAEDISYDTEIVVMEQVLLTVE